MFFFFLKIVPGIKICTNINHEEIGAKSITRGRRFESKTGGLLFFCQIRFSFTNRRLLHKIIYGTGFLDSKVKCENRLNELYVVCFDIGTII